MKKFCLWILVCLLCLTSCASGRDGMDDLAGAPFAVTLSYDYGGTHFSVRYTRTETEKVLVFSEPESMSGVTARQDRESGAVTLTAGGTTFAAQASAGMFYPTVFFDLPAKPCADGRYRLQSETANGFLTVSDGLPVRVAGSVSGREYDITADGFIYLKGSDGT